MELTSSQVTTEWNWSISMKSSELEGILITSMPETYLVAKDAGCLHHFDQWHFPNFSICSLQSKTSPILVRLTCVTKLPRVLEDIEEVAAAMGSAKPVG